MNGSGLRDGERVGTYESFEARRRYTLAPSQD